MGMNVYTLDGIHIGKRFAAGVWCWDCKVKVEADHIGLFYFCTQCGKRCSLNTLVYNPAFRELGFDKSDPRKKEGVDGASGFIWHVSHDTDGTNVALGSTVEAVRTALKKRRFVKTEYGEKWSVGKFWDMFLDIIEEKESGYEFS